MGGKADGVAPSARLGLAGGTVVSPAGAAFAADLLIEGGRIAAVGPGAIPPDCHDVLPVKGCWVGPGLIDLHLHGFAGVSPLLADQAEVRRMDGALAREGVTGYLVAFSAAPFAAVAAACQRLAAPGGPAGCLGAQLEGVFVNPEAAGAQDGGAMIRPDSPDAARWLDLPGLRGVVVAPELPGGLGLIRAATARGLLVFVGHTLADSATLAAAREAGALGITHFLNNGGAPSWSSREPGLLGAGMLDSSWWLEVIADGIHVHPDNLSMLRRCRGTHRVCMVSDARSASGLGDGQGRRLGDGVMVRMVDGRLITDGGALAGGSDALNAAVSRALRHGEPPGPLFAAAAANPARLLGLYPGRGAVVAGSRADLTVWSPGGDLLASVAGGILRPGLESR